MILNMETYKQQLEILTRELVEGLIDPSEWATERNQLIKLYRKNQSTYILRETAPVIISKPDFKKEEFDYVVYQLNLHNNRLYIGYTKNIKKRVSEHRRTKQILNYEVLHKTQSIKDAKYVEGFYIDLTWDYNDNKCREGVNKEGYLYDQLVEENRLKEVSRLEDKLYDIMSKIEDLQTEEGKIRDKIATIA